MHQNFLIYMKGMISMENKRKHLEMIQAIITRMSSNSFALKGWAVTLVAGLFALSSKDANEIYFLIAYIPIIAFWFLDAYYLMQERLYRNLYKKVTTLSEDEIDFSMDAHSDEFQTEKTTISDCFLSETLRRFYLPLALVTSGVIIVSVFF